ncbi:MAG: thymidylate synthase [Oscillospiraceae bacterium]|nr:thymidylate synthase [Oscillospiraceae bacterium]
MSMADQIFIGNCKDIIANGFWDTAGDVRPRWSDGTPAHTVKKFAVINRYDLSAEFPILTIRYTNYKKAIDEILWIWQKKSNNIKDLGSSIWDEWADEEGSIGRAYGYQLGLKHQYPEGRFDQVDRLLFDLKNNPYSRRMITNIYTHADLHRMNLYPCAYSMTLNVAGGKLNCILNQRSQDMLAANNWNVCQYSALLMMLAQASGLAAGELVHVIADAHIYDRHVPLVEKLLGLPQHNAPTVSIDQNQKDFYGFTVDSFLFKDYIFNKKALDEKIPVAV